MKGHPRTGTRYRYLQSEIREMYTGYMSPYAIARELGIPSHASVRDVLREAGINTPRRPTVAHCIECSRDKLPGRRRCYMHHQIRTARLQKEWRKRRKETQ